MVKSHKHNIAWVHTNGDIKKVAAYKVKPYELISQKNVADESVDMSED